ncbi:hypothetical protein ACKWTF_012639 [Chironomus riparius]
MENVCKEIAVYTSTPCLKSSQGRKILKQLFLTNFPKDVSFQEEVKKEDPIELLREKFNFSTPLFINTPTESLTPNTRQIFEENFKKSIRAKLKRRCIRL